MMHFVPEIIPAILAQTAAEAFAKWQSVQESEIIQIDCLDGQFVPNVSYFTALDWPTHGPHIELHLMCAHPLVIMESWAKHPLLRRVIWHREIQVNHSELITWCRQHKLDCGIALNPETPLEQVDTYVKDLDTLLLLGVHPGWCGQPFLATTLANIEAAHARYPELALGVDGGLTEELIPEVCKRGATHLYVGSHLFQTENHSAQQALHHLKHVTQRVLLNG